VDVLHFRSWKWCDRRWKGSHEIARLVVDRLSTDVEVPRNTIVEGMEMELVAHVGLMLSVVSVVEQ